MANLDRTFDENVDLDAALVLAGMRGGFDAVMMTAMRLGIEGGPDAVIARADWMKRKPKYLKRVAERAAELEAQA